MRNVSYVGGDRELERSVTGCRHSTRSSLVTLQASRRLVTMWNHRLSEETEREVRMNIYRSFDMHNNKSYAINGRASLQIAHRGPGGFCRFALSHVFMRAYVRTRKMPIGYLPLVATTAGVDAIGISPSARITIAVAGLHVCSLHGCIVCERYVAHCLSVAASM